MASENSYVNDLTRVDAVVSRIGAAPPSSTPSSRSPHRGHSDGTIRRWNVNGQWQNNPPKNLEMQAMFQFVNADGLPEPGTAKSKKASSQVRSHVMRNYLLKQKLHKTDASSGPATENVVDSSRSPLSTSLYGRGWKFEGCE
jgi:hypothetical protein